MLSLYSFFNKMVDDCKEDIVSYFTEQNKEKEIMDSKISRIEFGNSCI